MREINSLRHELRTHLNHITGYNEILLHDAQEYECIDVLPLLEEIKTNAEDIKNLIVLYLETKNDTRVDLFSTNCKERLVKISGIVIRARVKLQASNEQSLIEDLDHLQSSVQNLTSFVELLQKEQHPLSPFPEVVVRQSSRQETTSRKSSVTGTVLVVDDNPLNLDMVTKTLRRMGHTPVTALSGAEALEKLSRQHFDIILLDVIMPEMDGFQVLQKIRANPLTSEIPVVMVSALEDLDIIAACIEAGAEDYLPKNFDPVILRARLDSSLGKKYYHDQERMYLNALIESQRRLSLELKEGAAYVHSLLPEKLAGNVSTDWIFIPSEELGGDCFGYHWLNPDKLAVYLFDVSGHGIRAALMSVSIHHVLRHMAIPGADYSKPSQVLQGLNRVFPMEEQSGLYFTIWYGVIDIKQRQICYSSAGSPPAILLAGPASGDAKLLATENLMVGYKNESSFADALADLPDQGRIFLFSDGAYEITTRDQTLLGLEGLVEIVANQHLGKDLPTLLRTLRELNTEDRFQDDLCLLDIRFSL